jgi:hypothetical protein
MNTESPAIVIPEQKRGDPSPPVAGPPPRAMVVCKSCGLRNPVPIVAGPVAALKRPCGKCGVRSIPASQEPAKPLPAPASLAVIVS